MAGFEMLINYKNGISSMEIHRALGITQKSAWFMLQRLRTALHNRSFGATTKLGEPESEVEADETYIGGKIQHMRRNGELKYTSRAEGRTSTRRFWKAFLTGISVRFALTLSRT
jgi:hypothetical protein